MSPDASFQEGGAAEFHIFAAFGSDALLIDERGNEWFAQLLRNDIPDEPPWPVHMQYVIVSGNAGPRPPVSGGELPEPEDPVHMPYPVPDEYVTPEPGEDSLILWIERSFPTGYLIVSKRLAEGSALFLCTRLSEPGSP